MTRPEIRRPLDRLVDRLRFRADTFPHLAYQPLPQLGKRGGLRDEGVLSRWDALQPLLDDLKPRTALDIGAEVGFFTLSLGERGIPVVAVEMEPRSYRTLLHARDRLELENVGVLVLTLTAGTAPLLPAADLTLFMSVWHHLVMWHGETVARELLREIWDRTGKVLVFETGELEMPARYGLPDMGADPGAWIRRLLEEECADAEVRHLGHHGAVSPDGRSCRRNLFAVVRGG